MYYSPTRNCRGGGLISGGGGSANLSWLGGYYKMKIMFLTPIISRENVGLHEFFSISTFS